MKIIITDTRDRQALKHYRAGIPVTGIAEILEYESYTHAIQGIRRALQAEPARNVKETYKLETLRIDLLILNISEAAANGDPKAIAQIQSLLETKSRIPRPARRDRINLTDALETTINALQAEEKGADAAIIAAGKKIAARMDAATNYGTVEEAQKAAYLITHYLNTVKYLKEEAANRELGTMEFTGETAENTLALLEAAQRAVSTRIQATKCDKRSLEVKTPAIIRAGKDAAKH